MNVLGTQDSDIPAKLIEGTMKNIEVLMNQYFSHINQLFISCMYAWFEHE